MSIQLPFKAQVQQHDISIRFHHNNIQQHIFVKPSSSKVNTTFDQQTTVHGLAGPGAIQCTQPKFQCFPIPFPVQPAFAFIRFKCQTHAFALFCLHSPAFALIRFKCQTHAFAFFCLHSHWFASNAKLMHLHSFACIRPYSLAFACIRRRSLQLLRPQRRNSKTAARCTDTTL